MALFTGAGVAIVTPMKANGEVNFEKLGELLEFQIAGGTDSIIICGTTGEASTLTHEEQLYVSATISGKRSDVNDAKKNGLTATADVADCTKGKNTVKIIISTPDGINIENVSQSTISVKVEGRVTKARNVEMIFSGYDGSSDSNAESVPWVLDFYPETVTVSGAESSVEKVKKVIGKIEPEKADFKKSKWVDIDLVPVDKKGHEIYGLELSFDRGEAEIQRLSVKMVDLELSAADKASSTALSNADLPNSISIVGGFLHPYLETHTKPTKIKYIVFSYP